MAQPVWVTPAGSLGTIPEGIFYSTPIKADDPVKSITATSVTGNGTQVIVSFETQSKIPYEVGTDIILSGFTPTIYNGNYTVTGATTNSVTFSSTATSTATVLGNIVNIPSTVYYQLIAGQLPSGIQINENGIIAETSDVAFVQGIPTPTSLNDIVSKFAIRAFTTTTNTFLGNIKSLADRTFTLTVTGPGAPVFVTPSGQIAQYYDGSLVSDLQIEYDNVIANEEVVVKLVAGTLPTGLTLSPSGVISGLILPLAQNDVVQGYSRDGQGFDEYSFDFGTRSVNSNYEFTLEISNGKVNGTNTRTFSIYIWARSIMSADTTYVTADNTFITADTSNRYTPLLLTPEGSIGTVNNDNFYAFQFPGIDFDGDQFTYVVTPNPPAPGLLLNPESGWLYGYIPDLGSTEETYDFEIRVFKTLDPVYISNPYNYSLNIVGPINSNIVWLTPGDLGTIENGSTSVLYVEAVSVAGIPLQYRLVSGSDSSLPQGLELLPSGNIAGRTSFNTFAVDSGYTKFDVVPHETTFDMSHTFTVNAYSADGLISVTKTFTIVVVRAYNEPYDNLYIQAMPPLNDRSVISSLLENTNIFPPALIYREDDPNFGVARNIIYQHAYGLTATTLTNYVASLDLNHYWKNLVLGNIKTAVAHDDLGNVLYEVVYSEIIDDLVNTQGTSVGKEVELPYTVTVGNEATAVAYPNSLVNMRDQVIDTVGQLSNVLPRWMLSKQVNGQVLGFTPAWVIAYTKPGKSGQVAYNIETQSVERLNLIDFDVDRYELDNLLTKNWDRETSSWNPTPAVLTTFDIYSTYLYTNYVTSLGTTGQISTIDYYYGDGVTTSFEILDPTPNADKIVVTVGGNIQNYITKYTINYGQPKLYVTFVVPPAAGAGNNIEIFQIINKYVTNSLGPVAVETVFDYSSMQFTDPVDMYSNSNEYDKYLVFPKRNILE